MTTEQDSGPLAIDYERADVGDLRTYERNPRRGDVEAIADSLRRTGQYRPIVVNRGTETGRPYEVLAGNHTLLAARKLGWKQVDVGVVDVDENTAKRIVLADNRTADLGDYDKDILAEVLGSIDDLVGTGYDAEAYDAVMAAVLDRDGNTDEDDAPPLPEAPPISEPGDVWELGPHRLLVGSSTELTEVERMLGADRPDAIWTDPPYGVEYVGKTKDALRIENDGAAGLRDLLLDAFSVAVRVVQPGAPVYVAHADTERITFETALEATGVLVRQNLVWVKNTIVMGRSDYHYKHEPILEGNTAAEDEDLDGDELEHQDEHDDQPNDAGAEDARQASAERRDELPETPRSHTPLLYGFAPGGKGRLGRGGKRWHGDNKQATVFDIPKPPANRDHPTMKPVALIVAQLENSLRPGGIVYDPFGGSGSTMIAAHQHGSSARLVELDPRYADVICRRWQEHRHPAAPVGRRRGHRFHAQRVTTPAREARAGPTARGQPVRRRGRAARDPRRRAFRLSRPASGRTADREQADPRAGRCPRAAADWSGRGTHERFRWSSRTARREPPCRTGHRAWGDPFRREPEGRTPARWGPASE